MYSRTAVEAVPPAAKFLIKRAMQLIIIRYV